MVVLSFKDQIDPTKIILEKPVKSDGKWNINLKYSEAPLLFKTSRVRFNKESSVLMFNLQTKSSFVHFLENLEGIVINKLHENSTSLFNGRKFSLEKIQSSLNRSWDITENGNVILNTSCKQNVVCTDMFGEKTYFENINNNVSAVLLVKNISFTKNLFEIQFEISHLKMSRFEERPLDNPFGQEIQPVVVENSTNPTIEDDTGDFFLE